jgi:DNA (cytosine-5)-methyltransferase 1
MIPSALESAALRTLRQNCGLSQEELASHTGYSLKTIQRWESGAASPRLAVMEYLRSYRTRKSDGSRFSFIDLFAGIGGLRRPFDQLGGRCVFTSEWDKHAQVTYRANYGTGHAIAGDIVAVPSSAIPAHDLLLAGFPCQPFSLAGVSKKNSLGRPHGFADDTQGTLFFEVARILEHHKPKAFVLENVKNLASHDGGKTFRTILRVLKEELGYNISFRVIDARSFVPQHRERIFIVGFRDQTTFSLDDVEIPAADKGPRLGSVLHVEDGSEVPEPPYTDADGNVASKYVLSTHLWTYLKAYAEKHRLKGNGFGYGLFGPDDVARTLSARYHKDGAEILIKRGRGNPRRLTPRECARLMGYDESRGERFAIPVSDTQAYRQFGNSVVVPVVRAVAKAMMPHLLATPINERQLQLPLMASA